MVYRATKETYDKIAPKYASDHHNMSFWSVPMDIFSGYLVGASTVLDAGCGHGRDIKSLAEKGFRVIGIDYSEAMLEQARKLLPSGDFRQMDLRHLEFPDASFDAVWAAASIHHIKAEDVASVIQDFRRILRPNGIFFVGVREGKGTEMVEYVEGARRFFNYYDMDSLKALLTRHGFEILDTYSKPDGSGQLPGNWLSMIARKL
jgi:SAM-dependent methyltransferase